MDIGVLLDTFRDGFHLGHLSNGWSCSKVGCLGSENRSRQALTQRPRNEWGVFDHILLPWWAFGREPMRPCSLLLTVSLQHTPAGRSILESCSLFSNCAVADIGVTRKEQKYSVLLALVGSQKIFHEWTWHDNYDCLICRAITKIWHCMLFSQKRNLKHRYTTATTNISIIRYKHEL